MANKDDFEFNVAIRAAFDAYPKPRPSRGFEQRFWASFEARRGRYRGLVGWLRRLFEIEIEGVAVWRLLASTASGGAFCVFAFAILLSLSAPKTAPTPPLPLPPNQIPTAMTALAFFNRDWENEWLPKPQPKMAPPRPTKSGGEMSWNGSSAPLA